MGWDELPGQTKRFAGTFKISDVYVCSAEEKVWVQETYPTTADHDEPFTVYHVRTSIPFESFELGGLFKQPKDWLSFAKRIKAEEVMPKEVEGQLELIICPECNAMNYPDQDDCLECKRPLSLGK